MKGQLAGRDVVLGQGLAQQVLDPTLGVAFIEHPAHHVAAEQIQDHVQVVQAPLAGSPQFGDVPRPNLIRRCGHELRFGVVGVAQLVAALVELPLAGQQTAHGARRAQVDPLV